MASSGTHKQLKRVNALVERAAREPSTASVRREAFQELIELAHSSQPSLKSYAAGHIHVFFNDFPDLEEDAINAVYDLCEDQDSKVRMEGYHAVTKVSSVQHKWVKRNADVLVQLLQSDEPEEVAVVKAALLEHLDMDPPITLGVLCDQIVPPGENPDDDERQTRERLRSLVLSFLATDAMSAIQKYTDPPGSEAEHILVAQLILAISRLNTDDVDVIVKDILLRLPCSRDSFRGDELLQVILNKVATLLQTRSNDPAQLKVALHYLSVAQMTTVDFHATPAIKLLQFYISSLTRKLVLQKFPPEDRIQLISWIVDALFTSERESATHAQIAQLRRQVIDASSILLEVLFDSKLYKDDLWRSVKRILHTIKTRKELENWTLPPYLIASMSKFLQVLSGVQTQEDASEVQGLIRLLAGEQPSSSKVPIQEASPIVKNGIPPEWPAHLPPRPVTSPPPMPTKLDLPLWPAPIRDNASRHHHVASAPTSPKRTGSAPEDVPQPKRVKMNPGGQDIPTPSLLSRIAAAGDASSSGQSDRSGKRRKKRPGKDLSSPEPDRHPSTGYSIKGAASAQRNGNVLLNRMGREDSG
ncbi:apoptosis inhibitory protein 5-domain-containing protein [Chiua virens]|nr:apoptosis inhibitory protein 5-domain-containing protein [Chiua virens]